jgi:hypothetical protein
MVGFEIREVKVLIINDIKLRDLEHVTRDFGPEPCPPIHASNRL